MNTKALTRAFAVLLALPIAGCILLVDAAQTGDRCAFAGDTTGCGVCVRDRCQSEVDACCLDDSCRPAMALLEGCTTSRDARCDALRSAIANGGSSGTLSTCVAKRCAGACAPTQGKSETSCREPPLGAGSGCTCEANATTNDFVCTKTTYPESICCAAPNWPAAGLACSCRALGCNTTGDGCSCTLVDLVAPDSPVCAGATCCAFEDGCVCRSRPCYDWEKQVDKCSVAVVSCPRGTRAVDACSVTR